MTIYTITKANSVPYKLPEEKYLYVKAMTGLKLSELIFTLMATLLYFYFYFVIYFNLLKNTEKEEFDQELFKALFNGYVFFRFTALIITISLIIVILAKACHLKKKLNRSVWYYFENFLYVCSCSLSIICGYLAMNAFFISSLQYNLIGNSLLLIAATCCFTNSTLFIWDLCILYTKEILKFIHSQDSQSAGV